MVHLHIYIHTVMNSNVQQLASYLATYLCNEDCFVINQFHKNLSNPSRDNVNIASKALVVQQVFA